MPESLVSLCSGYGGLDLAAEAVFVADTVAFCEIEPSAEAIFARHWPDAQALGDLTETDWSAWAGVDVVTAGFPCQDLSYAGRGKGIKEGTRSGLWYGIEAVLGVVRPRWVALENVAAIVARRPGLDVVLAGLARLGFDAEWACVRASAVGAPHRRERWFLLAHAGGERRDGWQGVVRNGRDSAVGGEAGGDVGDGGSSHTAADAKGERRQGEPSEPDEAGALVGTEPRPGGGVGTRGPAEGVPELGRGAGLAWGDYAPAIRQWEDTIGRPAPNPADDRGRLDPLFVEWMMGLPDGWVTGTPGLSRAKQLSALGNGVVPQQAHAALAGLLARFDAPERALEAVN